MAFYFLAYLFLVLEIFTFLYYVNEESDDVIGGSTKTAQHSIENNSRNIQAMFFKLGTSNVHHKINRMIPSMLLPWQHSWLQSLSVKKTNIPICNFLMGARGSCLGHTWFPYCPNSPHYIGGTG